MFGRMPIEYIHISLIIDKPSGQDKIGDEWAKTRFLNFNLVSNP